RPSDKPFRITESIAQILGPLSDDLRRVATDESECRNVLRNNRSGGNDRALADDHVGKNYRVAGNPGVIADEDRSTDLREVRRINIVLPRIDCDMTAQVDRLANGQFRAPV